MKVLIADDQSGVRSALRFLLEQEKNDCVVTEVADGDSLLSQAARICPDVILLDAELAGLTIQSKKQSAQSLPNILLDIRALCPRVKVIALTSRPELHHMKENCQADILINKTDPPETLVKIIRDLCGNDIT
jgi:DNA-binding NarL/FixJ family response regulator